VYLSFVVCPNYHLTDRIITFNLKYVLKKINRAVDGNYVKKALDECPDIPPNEYVRWGCPWNIDQYWDKYSIMFTGKTMKMQKELAKTKFIK
jgi:hypothetical protein